MTLKLTKKLIGILSGCTAVSLLLFLLIRLIVLLVIAGIFAAGAAAINLIFWRCPYCGRRLGRRAPRLCPDCEKPLDMDVFI